MNDGRQLKTILVTGGAGFIGSHLVRRLVRRYPGKRVINLDALTYAGNLQNLSDLDGSPNYTFVRGDINKTEDLDSLFRRFSVDAVAHLAAESHVDRSIEAVTPFVQTNIQGTVNLLNCCREHWKGRERDTIFLHISTDEVFGSCPEGLFDESSPYHPNSPYAASKAASDHMVRAYGTSYDLPFVISNCSNNYGPNQFPEKLIPLFINNIIDEKPLPLYGDGQQVRDWLYVSDHVAALDLLMHRGRPMETYCIGGGNAEKNIDIARMLCGILDATLNRAEGHSAGLITFTKDRPGHDFRYAVDASKIASEFSWEPTVGLQEGLEKTVRWYLQNQAWLETVTSGDYREYYKRMYLERDQSEN